MSRKISYKIIINDREVKENKIKRYAYNYGSTKNVRIAIAKQYAVIEFEMSIAKTFDQLTSFQLKLFRDAYRKVYMIHAILMDYGLEVDNIKIFIDGEMREYTSENAPTFPFLFSMIENKKQYLNPGWKQAIDPILSIPKTKKDTDLRFCAVFSFLAAKNRNYRIDCFTNLWTTMNAYGNYLAKCYETEINRTYDLENASNKIKDSLILLGKDGKIVETLAHMIRKDLVMHSVAETQELWKNFFGVQSALNRFKKEDYKELYEEAEKALDDTYELPEKYKNLAENVARFDRPLFVFLLTDYPYYLRCNYLHGSLSTILFSAYNDYEINSLGVVNYFLERYLNEKLPEIFRPDFWNQDMMNEIIECLRRINGADRYDKALARLKKEYAR